MLSLHAPIEVYKNVLIQIYLKFIFKKYLVYFLIYMSQDQHEIVVDFDFVKKEINNDVIEEVKNLKQKELVKK